MGPRSGSRRVRRVVSNSRHQREASRDSGPGPIVGPQRSPGGWRIDERAPHSSWSARTTWTRPPPTVGSPPLEAPPSPVRHPARRVVRDARGRRDVARHLHGQRRLQRHLDVRDDHPRRHAGDVVQRERTCCPATRGNQTISVHEHGHRRAALRDDSTADNTDSKGLRAQLDLTIQAGTCAAPGAPCTRARSTAPRSATSPRAPRPATATSPPAARDSLCFSWSFPLNVRQQPTRTPPPRRRSPSPPSRRPTTRSPRAPPTSRPATHGRAGASPVPALQTGRPATGHPPWSPTCRSSPS